MLYKDQWGQCRLIPLRGHFKEDYQRDGKYDRQNHQQLLGGSECILSHDCFTRHQASVSVVVAIPTDELTSVRGIGELAI